MLAEFFEMHVLVSTVSDGCILNESARQDRSEATIQKRRSGNR